MFSKMTMAARLAMLVGVVVLATVLVGATGVYAVHRAQQASVASLQVQRDLNDTVLAARAAGAQFRLQGQDYRYLLLRGHEHADFERYLASFDKRNQEIDQEFDRMRVVMGRVGLPSEGVEDARKLHARIVAQYREALKQYDPEKLETVRTIDAQLRGKNRPLDEKIDLIVSTLDAYAQSEATRVMELSQAESRKATLVLGGAVLALVLLASALGLLFARSLRRDLGGEPAYAREVAARIAAGDLASRIEVGRGDSRSLLAAMQRMQDDLRSLVGEVATGARTVADTSVQIAQGNLDLSQRTEEQASTLEETASSMEELTTTVTQNAEIAGEATRLAREASGVAGKGGEVVAQVVGTMDAITESSRRIADIIGVIDGIAFQTNILALNAAVEAARAGEQGRGFAVVAAEVRSLAQRSAVAAREIKELISTSVERVEAGTRLVGAAGTTMTDIVVAVDKVSRLVAEIAAASREQGAGIVQVNTAVSQMDGVVQQNASLVEEATAATESMKAQAEALLRAVTRFRLEGQASLSERAPMAFEPALQAA